MVLRSTKDKDTARDHSCLEGLEGQRHMEHVPRREQTPGKQITRIYHQPLSFPISCEGCRISIRNPHPSPWATATVTFHALLLPSSN